MPPDGVGGLQGLPDEPAWPQMRAACSADHAPRLVMTMTPGASCVLAGRLCCWAVHAPGSVCLPAAQYGASDQGKHGHVPLQIRAAALRSTAHVTESCGMPSWEAVTGC